MQISGSYQPCETKDSFDAITHRVTQHSTCFIGFLKSEFFITFLQDQMEISYAEETLY